MPDTNLFLPSVAGQVIIGQTKFSPPGQLLTPWTGFAVFCGYALAVLADAALILPPPRHLTTSRARLPGCRPSTIVHRGPCTRPRTGHSAPLSRIEALIHRQHIVGMEKQISRRDDQRVALPVLQGPASGGPSHVAAQSLRSPQSSAAVLPLPLLLAGTAATAFLRRRNGVDDEHSEEHS
jgi:hypothetical protein